MPQTEAGRGRNDKRNDDKRDKRDVAELDTLTSATACGVGRTRGGVTLCGDNDD